MGGRSNVTIAIQQSKHTILNERFGQINNWDMIYQQGRKGSQFNNTNQELLLHHSILVRENFYEHFKMQYDPKNNSLH